MGRVKIPYYIVKGGRGYWNPTTTMKQAGFASIPCGEDGPAAWSIAATWNARWLEFRKGGGGQQWPAGSLGEAFQGTVWPPPCQPNRVA